MNKTLNLRPISVHITYIGAAGDGAGMHEGKPIYIPKTAPGDVAEVQIEKQTKDHAAGRLIRIITPGPERQAAPCQYYDACGGCALQHITPDFYRHWKADLLQATLSRAGAMPDAWLPPVFLPSAARRRITLAAQQTASGLKLGLHAPRSHHIVPIENCLVLEPALDACLPKLAALLHPLIPAGAAASIMLQHVGGALDMLITGRIAAKGKLTLAQHEYLSALTDTLGLSRLSLREQERQTPDIHLERAPVQKTFGALTVHIPPGAFLQASQAGEDALTGFMQGALKDQKIQNAVDLFSGCGTFAGDLIETGAKILAVESDKPAMEALQKTRHPHLKTLRRDLFKEPLSPLELASFDLAVIDPPRAGAKTQMEMLACSGVPTIISISCNPASFARDARILLDAGYKFISVQLIDQFTWSEHCEMAGIFEL